MNIGCFAFLYSHIIFISKFCVRSSGVEIACNGYGIFVCYAV